MRKVFMIMRREYLTVLKNKMFWIGTLLIPFGIVALMAVSIASQFVTPDKVKPIALIEAGDEISAPVAEALEKRTFDDGRKEYPVQQLEPDGGDLQATYETLKPQLQSGELYAVVTIGPDFEAEDNFQMYRKSVSDPFPQERVRDAISDVVIGKRLAEKELDLEQEELRTLLRSIALGSFEVKDSGEATEKGFEVAMISTFVFILILFMTLYFYGYQMARGVIQEKTNKVMEVLLGSVSADQLMAGKILGIGLTGLTQMAIYAGFGTLVQLYTARAAMAFGGGDVSPEIMNNVQDALSPERLFYFVVFFLLGYFLFTSLFAIVGAVCSTEQDAQQLQMPVMMCLMIPYISSFFFIRQPDSLAAVIMSFIPVFTPMIMFIRISVLEPPFWQIALSILLLIGTIFLTTRVAAKIFRVGTLMTGKRPSIPEILRWARS